MDLTIPFRFVGSYEYANALDSFNRLLAISSLEELLVYDKILNERPEFTYFNGANTAFAVRPDMRMANPFDRKKFNDSFQKRGLAWMMALARVELGATMSLYGDNPRPFETISTSNFDLVPYVEVLADDVVAHMKSLAQEADFEEVVRRSRKIDTWTLAYLRRIKLIRDMLSALSSVGDEVVKTRIRPYDRELKKYEKRLIQQIQMQTRPQSYGITGSKVRNRTVSETMKVSNEFITDCEDIVKQSDPNYKPGSSGSDYPNYTSAR